MDIIYNICKSFQATANASKKKKKIPTVNLLM